MSTLVQPTAAATGAAANGELLGGLSDKLEGFQQAIAGTPDNRNMFSQALQDMSGSKLGKYRAEMTDAEKSRQDLLAQIGQNQQTPQFSPVQMAGGQQGNPLSAYIAQMMGKGGQV
ncbi:hypothetical protein [Pseudochrobactrum kiredjianiae]|uniref:DUF4175 domain-containing protein n=1 Tax=Pseudochrobactrum kiredjianiae TaxID=386305 RepID=A0ABW3V309_9HYPH|nr:hypothetical protein [Pseudochrobactrum kiredjianiae]MDM7852368.1 hypothetical protein [Pseudochrobactrum kiredjianiae]